MNKITAREIGGCLMKGMCNCNKLHDTEVVWDDCRTAALRYQSPTLPATFTADRWRAHTLHVFHVDLKLPR